MNARMIDRIETNVERGAVALLAGAIGYAAYALLGASMADPQRLACAGGAAAFAGLLCALGMKAAGGRRSHFAVPIFDVRDLDGLETDELLLTEQLQEELVLTDSDRLGAELVLTDADRLHPTADLEEPLVLDDVLAAVGADARVVRLFDRKAMPTPGQLGSSIDRHLERDSRSAHPDAAQALSDALAELRRSLR
jgi:hypothetical protein